MFPDNNRVKVQHEKSNQKYLTRATKSEQISGTLPTSCSCRVFSIICPSRHTKLHCLETFQIRSDLRAYGKGKGTLSFTTQFTVLHKFHEDPR